jgi:hypothetical protein
MKEREERNTQYAEDSSNAPSGKVRLRT